MNTMIRFVFCRRLLHGLLAVVLVAFGANTAGAGGKAQVMVDASGISVSSTVADVRSMQFAVADPRGQIVYTTRSKGAAMQWSPSANAIDGYYTYEVRITTGSRSLREGGRVRVEGGVLLPSSQREWKLQKRRSALEGLGAMLASGLMRALDVLVPAAAAQGPNVPIAGDHIAGNAASFFDGSVAGFWGVNHTQGETVEAHVHVQGAFPIIDFEDTVNTPQADDWLVGAAGGAFGVFDFLSGTFPLLIQTGSPSFSMTVAPVTGDVGLGTLIPTSPLHVLRSDGTARLLVEEASATPGTRQLFTLQNNGPIGFGMVNTDSSQEWRFAAQVDGFRVSLGGTGGPELTVLDTGAVTMGPGAATTFDLDAAGNLLIAGGLTQNSDVNAKVDFTDVDGQEVLARLASLPISQWRYRRDDTGARHLGPTAQDFHAAFGLGADERHIAPMDAAGVALAAVQVLQRQVQERDVQIRDLQQRLAAMEATLATPLAQAPAARGVMAAITPAR